MADTLDNIYKSLAGQYDPQEQLIQQQQTALPGQETAAIAGADAAKNNAFDQNQNNANAMGMLYSGQGLENNNRYIGSTYAPAIAGIKSNTQQQGYQLQNALLGVRQNRGTQAQSILADQMNREQQQRQYEQQRKDSIDQFNRQLAASQAQAAAARQASVQAAQQTKAQAAGFSLGRDAGNGFAIKGPNGAATLAQYVGANGGGFNDVLSMLAQGSANDKKLAATLSTKNWQDPRVQVQLTSQYPYIFGGI